MTDWTGPVLLVPAANARAWADACAETVRALGASVTAEPRAAVAQAALGRPLWVCGSPDLRIEAEPAYDWLQRRYPRLAVVAVPAVDDSDLIVALRRQREHGGWHWPRWWPWRELAHLLPVATSSVGEVFAADGATAGGLLLLRALAADGPLTAPAYALTVAAEVERQYRTGLRLLALGSAPNTPAGGWGAHWRSAAAHGAWWLMVAGRLRGWFPELRIGYPALAGAARGDALLAPDAWLDLSQSALRTADWLLVGTDWSTPAGRWALSGGQLVKVYRRRLPLPPLVLIGPHPSAVLGEQAEGTVGIGAVISAPL